MKKQVMLELKSICKSFIETRALDNVSFDIFEGEIRGLIGENGSGKSTLASIIVGIIKPDQGEMLFYGKKYYPLDQIEANDVGISMIVQEMNTIEGLTVAENMFLGREEEFLVNKIINRKEMNDKTEQVLKEFGLSKIRPEVDIAIISFESRKLIELAKSVYSKPKLLIVDEATSTLSRDGRNKLFEIMNDLRNKGNTIIFITHDLQELIKICDTITVLRDGKLINTFDNNEITEDFLKNTMVGRQVKGEYYRNDYDKAKAANPVLEINNISSGETLVDVSFNLNKGEILGIGGLAESGMHTLGKIIFGSEKSDKGYIKLVETRKIIKNIKDSISNGMGYVSKNRDQEGVMLLASIRENISLPSLGKFGRFSFVNPKKERDYCLNAAKRLQVKMSSIEQLALFLSGGNKQKVALAKWIARECNILVLDSPTRGIDVMVKASIYDLMKELVKSQKSIIMISEEIIELIGMCDRVIILKKGKINKEFLRNKDLTEERIINFMI